MGDYVRSEREEERACDRCVLRLGGDVVRFSQSRATQQTMGISDRRYRVLRMAFWFEVKAADGKLTREQYRFLTSELECGSLAGCGTERDLILAVGTLAGGDAPGFVAHLRAQVERWAAKGFRGERAAASKHSMGDDRNVR